MNWAAAESEAYRRCALADDCDAEDAEYQRYLALQAEEKKELSAAPQNTSASICAPVITASTPLPGAPSVRAVLEREHASRRAILDSQAQASRCRDAYVTGSARTASLQPTRPVATADNEDAWKQIQGNSKQHAKDSLDFLSQWNGVLR